MTEGRWFSAKHPVRLWPFVRGDRNARKLRLFGCACCRRLGNLVTDARSLAAIELAERFADGLATKAELTTAKKRLTRAANALFRKSIDGGMARAHWYAHVAVQQVTTLDADVMYDVANRASQAFPGA